jgi:predicted ribosome-associated RNA-binding protein Tma20
LAQIFKIQAEPVDGEVIVDEACGLAVLRGADVFAPGILALNPLTPLGSMVGFGIALSHLEKPRLLRKSNFFCSIDFLI